jgi:acyl-CoA thioesterase I
MNDPRRTLWVLMSTSIVASSLALGCGPSADAGGENASSGDNAAPHGTPNSGSPVLTVASGEKGSSGDRAALHGTPDSGSPVFTTGSSNEGGAPSGSAALTGADNAPAATGGEVPTTVPAPEGLTLAPPSLEASTPPQPASPTVPQPGAMTLISQGLPAYSNYAQSAASNAIDADYSTVWRTGHDPSAADSNWLAIDLSTVPTAQRTAVYAVWFNEYGYNYDTSDGPSYTLPGDFEIQASPMAGGGQPPSTGWVALASTTANTLSSGANLLKLGGYNWVRFNCTASASNVAAQNTDTSLQWNLYDAHAANDGWKFGGDSITANSMGHKSTNDSFDQLVHKQVANNPAFEMAGHGGWSTSTMLGSIDAFLADFPGLYFGLALGTNDAPGNDAAGYGLRMGQLIDKVIAAGKIPVLPTIPYTGEPAHAQIPSYNAQISALYLTYGSKLIQGPDLYTVIYKGRATMFDSPTDLHPNAAGNAAMRQAWADAIVKNVYGQ